MHKKINKEALNRANKLKKLMKEAADLGIPMPGPGQDAGVPENELEKLEQRLSQNDEIPPEMVETIMDNIRAALGAAGQGVESPDPAIEDAETTPEEEQPEELAERVERKRQLFNENVNWARVGKDGQLFKELRKRWCK